MGTLTITNTFCGTPYQPTYGLLYNWYAATDARKISSSDDWVVPSNSQFTTLINNAGGFNATTNNKLKAIGTTYWTVATGTDDYDFDARGSMTRDNAGNFAAPINSQCIFWSSTIAFLGYDFYYYLEIYNGSGVPSIAYVDNNCGHSLRLLYVGVGTPTSYTGNDGKNYRTVTIGTQTWIADNLCETKFRTGDNIPWFGANPENYFTNAEWAALTTAGCCAYDNDVNNVATGFSFPT